MIEEFSGQFREIQHFCRDNHLLPEGSVVICALSGGADSVFLFYFLLWLRERQSLTVYAAHLNHKVRTESDADQQFVTELCATWEIPLFLRVRNVRELAAARRMGLEEAGRWARQQFFEELIDDILGQRKVTEIGVATGHHQDDLAESVLLQIGRGAGLAGMTSLRVCDGIYVRPLLTRTKLQIETLLKQRQWSYVIDQSNHSDIFLRNRLRHELLPRWSEILGYDVKPMLARLAFNLQADRDALQDWAARVGEEIAAGNDRLPLGQLRDLPDAVLKRVLDQWLIQATDCNFRLGRQQFEQLIRIVRGNAGNKSIDIGDGVKLKRQGRQLIIVKQDKQDKQGGTNVKN